MLRGVSFARLACARLDRGPSRFRLCATNASSAATERVLRRCVGRDGSDGDRHACAARTARAHPQALQRPPTAAAGVVAEPAGASRKRRTCPDEERHGDVHGAPDVRLQLHKCDRADTHSAELSASTRLGRVGARSSEGQADAVQLCSSVTRRQSSQPPQQSNALGRHACRKGERPAGNQDHRGLRRIFSCSELQCERH